MSSGGCVCRRSVQQGIQAGQQAVALGVVDWSERDAEAQAVEPCGLPVRGEGGAVDSVALGWVQAGEHGVQGAFPGAAPPFR